MVSWGFKSLIWLGVSHGTEGCVFRVPNTEQ